MKINHLTSALIVTGAVAFAALGMTGAAQAQNVYWSVGLSSPDVQLGVSSAPPSRVLQPIYQPVYRQPRPLYLAPRPVVYLPSTPVFVAPPQYIRADWRYPAHRRGWQHWQERHEIERADHDHRG